MDPKPAIPAGREALTVAWMQQALAAGGREDFPAIGDVVVEDIGVGIGMVAEILRCHLTYHDDAAGAPRSVVVKLPSSHAKNVKLSKRLHLYKRECAYYRDLAQQDLIRSPVLFYGDFEPRTHRFVLLLEDLRDMAMFDEIDGAGAEQSKCAIRSVAKLHAGSWNKFDRPPFSGAFYTLGPKYRPPVQLLYLALLRRTLDLFGELFSDEMRRLAEAFGPKVADYMADLAAGPKSFTHGDFRLDNMCFGADGHDEVVVFDWQVSGISSSMTDVSYFLGGSLDPEIRRAIERETVQEYHDLVCGMGVRDFTVEECWRLYRQNMLVRLVTIVVSIGGLDLSSERGFRVAGVLLSRTLAALEDLDAEEFLPTRRRLLSLSHAFSTASRCAYKASKVLRRT